MYAIRSYYVWAIAGLVTWLAGLFLFSYTLYGVVFSTVSFLKVQNLPQIIIGTGSLIAFNLADLSIALLATIILSRLTGFKLLWLVAFFIAANFVKIELLIGTLQEYQSSNVRITSYNVCYTKLLRFAGDGELSAFLRALADEEAGHLRLMERARPLLEGSAAPDAVAVDALLREQVEERLRRGQERLAGGGLGRAELLELLAAVEFSEWNDLFLYVISYNFV